MDSDIATEPLTCAGRRLAVTVVVCSLNRPALLADCVDSVLACDPGPAEIVIVDQSDAPNAAMQAIASDRVRYIWTRAIGLSRSRNAGARAASEPVIVFTDDDVLAAPDWIDELFRALASAGPRSVVTGRVPPADAPADGHFAPSTKSRSTPACYTEPGMEDVLYGANMALSRTDFEQIGGFDESLGPGTAFPAAEDNDLGLRLLRAGFRIHYAPTAVVFHRAWREQREYVGLRWRYGAGQGAFYAKHLDLHDQYALRRLRWDVIRHILRVPGQMRTSPRLACGDALYALGLLTGAARWLTRGSTHGSAVGSYPAR